MLRRDVRDAASHGTLKMQNSLPGFEAFKIRIKSLLRLPLKYTTQFNYTERV